MQNATDIFMQNDMLRAAFLSKARLVMRPVPAVSLAPAASRIALFRLAATGLLIGTTITVTASLTNSSAATAVLSNFGLANLVKRIILTDLSNNQRVDVDGRSLHAINSARQGWLYGAAYNTGIPTGFGFNKPIFNAPATLAAGATTVVTMQYYVPAAYSKTNLRGAIQKNFFNNSVQITVELNDQIFGSQIAAEAPLRPVDSVYNATTLAGANLSGYTANSQVTVNCLEHYYDGEEAYQYIPPLDVASTYEIKTVGLNTPTANSDYAINYVSQRENLSSYVIFDNAGTFGDVNLLQSQLVDASSLIRHNLTSLEVALMERQIFMADTPDGATYFDYRNQPINTITNGAVALLMKWAVVNPGARVFHTIEAFLDNGIGIAGGTVPSLSSVQ